jgi:diguanylate cyclase (GGDEF)-like protein
MAVASETMPPSLSTPTVAHMIQIFDSMYRAPTALTRPIFDIEQLSTTLFAMGVEQEVISTCGYRYFWNFGKLLPALYDGSFFGVGDSGRLRGQEYLRGFATFLCGAFVQHSQLRTHLNALFEQSLLRDGYRFDGRFLVEVGLNVSATPELSELPSRESLLRDASSQLQSHSCVALLFIDLDHFKQVNDQLSHHEGNRCLALIVRTVSEVLRNRGKLYRVGGDEFCALLPNFGTEEAAASGERIRRSIDALPLFGGRIKVTASLGVAASDQRRLLSAEELVRAADDAMYVSKFTTKNRVCIWPPDEADARQAEVNRKKAEGASRRD